MMLTIRNSVLRPHALLLAACLLTLAGCNQDPAKTVHLEVSGISADSDREDVLETLKGMTDGSGHSYTSSYSGDKLSVSLSPVSDVEAFSKKINFGKVTSVDVATRTVKVDFVP